MHHLEVTDASQVDDEVMGWLAVAADHAGGRGEEPHTRPRGTR
jgi:hypothetical protein